MRVNLVTLLGFALVLAVLSWMVAAPFWAYLVMGLVLATVAYPMHEALTDRLGQPRMAAMITITATVLLVLLPLGFLAWRIVLDMRSLVTGLTVADVSGGIQAGLAWSHQAFGYPATVDPGAGQALLDRAMPEIKALMADWAMTALTSLASFVLGLVITAIVMYYALIDGPAFVDRLKDASPMEDALEQSFLEEAGGTVQGVVMGQLVTAILQGVLGFLAFFVAGVPSPFFWGFVMAVLSFLPVVGAFLVWFPAAIYLFAIGETLVGVGLLIWGVVIISTVDNVVKPVIIGRRGQVHPLLAFVGVLGGLSAFGFLGFLMGPLILSLAASVFHVLAETDWDAIEQGQPAHLTRTGPAGAEPGEPQPDRAEGSAGAEPGG